MAIEIKTSSTRSTATKEPLPWGALSFLGILMAFTLAGMGYCLANPHVPPYSGPIEVTGKYIKGYACHVEYTLPTGEKKVYWAGKPGVAVCSRVHVGPARMDGIYMRDAS